MDQSKTPIGYKSNPRHIELIQNHLSVSASPSGIPNPVNGVIQFTKEDVDP